MLAFRNVAMRVTLRKDHAPAKPRYISVNKTLLAHEKL